MGDYYGTENGRLQILYLRHKLDLCLEDIARITGYAVSTVRNYLIKYQNRLEEALDLFFYNLKKPFIKNGDNRVLWECDIPNDNIPCAYVCEIYNGVDRLFLKIGYSAHMETRMVAHATNSRYGSDKVIVRKVYQFNSEEQALSMENLLRKYYKDKNNCKDFIKNDRFTEQKPIEKDFETFDIKSKFILENF